MIRKPYKLGKSFEIRCKKIRRAFILLLLSILINISFSSAISLNYQVKVGDLFSWKVSEIEDMDGKKVDRDEFLISIWNSWEYETVIIENISSHYDWGKPHGIYANESLTITITSVPTTTYNPNSTYARSRDDFPTGIFQTNRDNESRYMAPHLSSFLFIIPINDIQLSDYDNHTFNDQGVLKSARMKVGLIHYPEVDNREGWSNVAYVPHYVTIELDDGDINLNQIPMFGLLSMVFGLSFAIILLKLPRKGH